VNRLFAHRRAALPFGVVLLGLVAGRLISVLHGTSTVPWGVELGYGLVYGTGTALMTIGLVLVYRSARIINFTQAAFGANAAILFLLFTSAEHWNYWLALVTSVAATAVAAFLVELLVLRRFSSSPRLVLTLITVALLLVLDATGQALPRAFGFRPPKNGQPIADLPTSHVSTPFDHWRFHWAGAPFNGDQVVLVVASIAIAVALSLFLRRSRIGSAVRGASENASRLEQLGISTGVLSSTVWVLIAVLAAVSGILSATAGSATVAQAVAGGGAGYPALMTALAAAVFAGMEDLPLAFASALGLALLEQGLAWSYNNDRAVIDLIQFGLILVLLLLQRRRRSRTDAAASSSWVGSEEIRAIPTVLRGLAPVQTGLRRAYWVAGLLVAGYPFVVSAGQLSTGTTFSIYGIVGVSIVILTGWAGQVSLGQFAFVAIGALTGGAVVDSLHLPFALALVAGSVAAAAVAVVVGLPALRLQGLYLAVTTLALAVALSSMFVSNHFLADHLPGTVGRPSVLGLDMNTNARAYFYFCVGMTAAVVYLAMRLRRSRTGRILIAMRDNEQMAQAYGVHLVRARLLAFALSGGMAGFAGVLYAAQQRSVTAGSYGPDLSVAMFLMAVLGGLGSVYAVLAGAIYFGTASTIFSGQVGQLLTSGLGVIAIMLFFPAGLGAVLYAARDAWLRRIAQRFRIYVPSLAGDRIKRGEEALVPIVEPVTDEPVPVRYRLDSRIGEAGRSQQLAKAWRY
jgi:branched-chain amino acid transport system permease protein